METNRGPSPLDENGRSSGRGDHAHDFSPPGTHQPDDSEERFRLLVESVCDYAIFMLDPAGRVVSWNLGAERIKGYAPDEIIGRHFSLFYTPEAVQRRHPDRELEIASEVGRYEEEGWRVRKDGSRFWANVVITALRDASGCLKGFAKVTRDFSERKRAEEALRQSEERFRLMVDSVKDYAIFMLDPQGIITSWNTGGALITGYTSEEAIGKHFSLFYTREGIRSGCPARELEVATRDGRYEEEGWRLRKDGSGFWSNVVISAVRDESGELLGFTKVTRDMTEQRRAREALSQLAVDLERRVRERTEELEAANRDIEAFSYSVSHDLRAPLRALDGFSKMLLASAGERLTPGENEYLQRIRSAAQRMSQLIDDMLNLSRLSRATVSVQVVDLAAMATEIIRELQRADPSRDVEVIVEERLDGEADPRLLGIALENLLANAWKFTRKQPRARIEVGRTTKDGKTAYFVRDNGVGFDMKYSGKLFMPFQRLHSTREFEGTGIGLATVNRIIHRHGGTIWAESQPGLGATFFFTLDGKP